MICDSILGRPFSMEAGEFEAQKRAPKGPIYLNAAICPTNDEFFILTSHP